MKQFEITLKNEKLQSYNRISWIIIAINVIFFLYLAIFSAEKPVRIKSIGTLLLLSFCFFLKIYFQKTKWQIGFRPFFYFLMLGWISIEQYWIAAITVIFDVLNVISTRKLITTLAEDKITYASFPKKKILWDELNGVILKDDLLTIDFKNNKLIQQSIDENSRSINEAEFNEFCRQQLKK